MDFITLLLLALALSADAFAVAVTDGITGMEASNKNAMKTALIFGLFQALMPILGYLLGTTFSGYILMYQHWVALFLLCAIGINMLAEAYQDRNKQEELCAADIFSTKNLIPQGIATSIDALAAGVSLLVLEINIYISALLIGIITFCFCYLGVNIGKRFGSLLGIRARLTGAIILIAVGLKIFFENQFFAH